jgi:hypothetical protein
LPHDADSEEEFNQDEKYDKLSVLVWWDGESSDDGAIGNVNNPDAAQMPVNVDPPVASPKKGFGLSFMDAQYMSKTILKMLNSIQAPKYMYSYVLK